MGCSIRETFFETVAGWSFAHFFISVVRARYFPSQSECTACSHASLQWLKKSAFEERLDGKWKHLSRKAMTGTASDHSIVGYPTPTNDQSKGLRPSIKN